MRIFFSVSLLFFGLVAKSQVTESLTIYFDFDSYRLTKGSVRSIDSMLRTNKKENYRMKFELRGHCDSRGSNDYNNSLSEKRAKTVLQYLVAKGINRESVISVTGAGELEPLNENNTDAERLLNRRVGIRIIKENKVMSLEEKIADTSVRVGTNIVLRNINFVGGRHVFLPESIPALVELREAMRAYPDLVIRIEGHICCVDHNGDGPDLDTGEDNLSEERAKAVKEYLVANGIEETRVSYKGFGHSTPLFSYPEKNEEEQKLNRRVEIKIISK